MVLLPSRRDLIGTAAASLALLPGLAHGESPPSAPEGTNIQGRSDKTNRLMVDAKIGDKGPYRFIVDTGADRSVIAADLAQSLGLIPGEQVIVQGIARPLPAQTVELRNVTLGDIVLDRLTTPILPREWLDADGYLGIDAIEGRRVTFDFQRHKLTVAPSANLVAWRDRNEALLHMNGESGRLTDVDCRVDGVHADAFIDTGAEISIGNSRLFAELQKNGGAYLSDAPIPLFGVTGGEAQGRLMAIDKIKVGALTFTNVLLVICDLSVFDVWGLSGQPALFIGMNLLKKTSLFTIDYGRKELLFRLAQFQVASRV